MHQADAFLEQLCEALDVDLMPGERDPTNVALPQQPIVRTVLPKSSRYKSLVCATNPCWYRVGARTILAQSGQALDDVMRYVEGKTRLEMAAAMLDWRHIAPSAPDTLWCYPFRSQDPFIIEACPDIYVIGNQPAFETTVVEGDDGQQVRVVLLPAFASTGTLARVDLASLACQSVQLDTAL